MNRHPESRITRYEAQQNALLGFLRSRPKAVGESHRTNSRHESSARARLAWNEGEKRRVVPARLLNISRTGAALVVATPPPEAVPVLIRLMGEEPTPWIEAEVVGVESLRESRSRVRLKFLEFCPNLFLKSAVLGTTPSNAEAPPETTPEEA
jgi:PilZ domain